MESEPTETGEYTRLQVKLHVNFDGTLYRHFLRSERRIMYVLSNLQLQMLIMAVSRLHQRSSL